MGFESVRFLNFRNLLDRELSLGAREVFLIGENGQGKTNMLESLYLLSVAASFRESREAAFFRDAASPLGLSCRYRDEVGGERTFSLSVDAERKKRILVNGKEVPRSDLLGQVLSICFVQQDMLLVSGSPEERRRFLDQTLVLSDPAYFEALRGYRRVLRARNFVLKQGQDGLLDAYDAQLVPFGKELTRTRMELVTRLRSFFSALFRDITATDQGVDIRYSPSWRLDDDGFDAEEKLRRQRDRDLAFGTTTSGPHRDVVSVIFEGREYSSYASTGQVRLCALVMRAAQARYLAERTEKKPILLLDDVLLELDQGRKRAFIDCFPPFEQAFFTFLPDENYLPYRHEDTLLLTVENGAFRPW